MKQVILPFILLFIFSCKEKNETTLIPTMQKDSAIAAGINSYDSVYAKRLGADQYGMKKYVMAFLKRGPNRLKDSALINELQTAHLKNIMRMADEGKLVVAGPFLDDIDTRGIYIFNVETIEEAKKLTETDPAIKAGTLIMELHPWYGSAAMQEVVKTHKRLEKKSVADS